MTTSVQYASLALTGRSGIEHVFTLRPWGTQFQPVCAVYAIFAQQSGGYYVLYIGETGNCAERFEDHHKAWCFLARGATHIGLLFENTERRRLAIEADLVAAYTPRCNG